MADIHVSFDIETLSTRTDGVILSIAAVARLPDGTLSTFYTPVSITSQKERMISNDTLAWWHEKGDLWKQTLAECEGAPTLANALGDLATWYASLGTDKDRLFPWGNGANFDIAFLEHAFDEQSMTCPWQYWTGRDLRTLKMLAEATGRFQKPERVGTHHNALDDATTQLLTIEAALEVIHDRIRD